LAHLVRYNTDRPVHFLLCRLELTEDILRNLLNQCTDLLLEQLLLATLRHKDISRNTPPTANLPPLLTLPTTTAQLLRMR
jgi:hypothetical protein